MVELMMSKACMCFNVPVTIILSIHIILIRFRILLCAYARNVSMYNY